jgi:hypothetical protein
VIVRRALVVVLLAAGAPGVRAEVTAGAVLHVRYTDQRNLPSEQVLLDPGLRTFALRDYLLPAGADAFGSTYAALRFEGDHLGGDLRWTLRLDTGVVRNQRYPALAEVCSSAVSPTGLAIPGAGLCTPLRAGQRIQFYTLETSAPGAVQLTSNGRPVADEVRQTLLVREAFVSYAFGRAGFATVRAGRRRAIVADGFVYDDYATGAELALDLGAIGPPLLVTASAFQPTRDLPSSVAGISPLLVLRLDWLPSLFEHAGVFAAFHRDRTGSIAELFRSSIEERGVAALAQADEGTAAYRAAANTLANVLDRAMTSDARSLWAGTTGSLAAWRGGRLGWTGALLAGRVDRVGAGPGGATLVAEDVRTRGGLASLRAEQGIGDAVTVDASFLWLSGGHFPGSLGGAPATGTYGGFLGLSPYVTATNLFFQGGLDDAYEARQATAPGIDGRGVLAPVAGIVVHPWPALALDARAAWLRADRRGPTGGFVYGTETDLEASWSPRRWVALGAEVDALWPGDFFTGRATMFRAIAALDLVFE